MSTPINIQGTIVNIPTSGDSPNWAPAITLAFQLIANALQAFVGPFDVSPQVYVMVSNVNTNANLPNLAFPTSEVRGAFIRYSAFRMTTTDTVSETGNIIVTYNPDGPIGQKWEISRDYDGDAQITFNVTDVGQIQFSTTLLPGASHTGAITYVAQALLQD